VVKVKGFFVLLSNEADRTFPKSLIDIHYMLVDCKHAS